MAQLDWFDHVVIALFLSILATLLVTILLENSESIETTILRIASYCYPPNGRAEIIREWQSNVDALGDRPATRLAHVLFQCALGGAFAFGIHRVDLARAGLHQRRLRRWSFASRGFSALRLRNMRGSSAQDFEIASVIELDGTDFRESNLAGLRFSDSVLTSYNFAGVDLTGADMTNGFGSFSTFAGARMQNFTMLDADLEHACLDEADLRGAFLADLGIVGASFRNADLRGASLIDIDLEDVDFSGADLRGAHIFGCWLNNVDFSSANVHGTIWTSKCGYTNVWEDQTPPKMPAGQQLPPMRFEPSGNRRAPGSIEDFSKGD